jgi:hypothetical protein
LGGGAVGKTGTFYLLVEEPSISLGMQPSSKKESAATSKAIAEAYALR